MSLKVKDVAHLMEIMAPLDLKENYDNVGLMVGSRENDVTNILVALDCTMKVIREAIDKKCSLILTHHPILFRKPSTITTDSLSGTKLIELIKNNIDVYSSHTNLDKANGGINDIVVEMLGYSHSEIMDLHKSSGDGQQNCGVGRLISLEQEITLTELCDKVKEAFKVSVLRYSGSDNKIIRKIAVVNGSGSDYFDRAKALKADCIITGDTTYHYVSDFEEEDIAIIDPGHFATEWPAMKVFGRKLEEKLTEAGYDNSVLLSSEVFDPYKYR
jgi:dinuclear metal center YbgI/SA1388 family protein